MSFPQTVLITGGSRGIGAATVVEAARRGWRVCFSYRSNQQAAEEVVARVAAAGGTACCVQADQASEEDIERLWTTAIAELGTIGGLVNNAGILETQGRLEHFSKSRMMRIFEVNVVGSLLCMQHAIRHMSLQHGGQGGSIVNVSSTAARIGAAGEYVDYAASKGALDTATLGAAKEVAAEGIRINGIRPGLIDTEIHASGGEPNRLDRYAPVIPMKRGGRAEEVAAAILWLLSEESSFTTGALIDIAGGL